MIWKPNVTVAAVIEDAGRFLLVEEQADGRVVINQPAGHLEPGESLQGAAIREVREETARDFRPDALIGVYRWRHPSRNLTFMRICLGGTVGEQDTRQALDTDILRTLWMTREQLLDARHRVRSPLVIHCLDDYLAGRRYPLDILRDIPDGSGSVREASQK